MTVDALAGVVGDAIDAVILLFGVGFVWQAATLLSHQRTLSRLETSETGAVRNGLVAVEGEILGPVEDGLVSPFRRETGVLARWSVEEFAGHELGTHSGWTEFGSGYEAVPFVVDDGSGPVTVEVGGEEALRRLELDLDGFGDDPTLELDVDERPPEHVREFLDTRDVRDRQSEAGVPTAEDGDEQGDRQFYETVLGRGDEVYVAGIAGERGASRAASDRSTVGSSGTATISPPSEGESGTFYLSDRGRSTALRRRLARVAVMAVVGGLLVWYEIANFVPGVHFVRF